MARLAGDVHLHLRRLNLIRPIRYHEIIFNVLATDQCGCRHEIMIQRIDEILCKRITGVLRFFVRTDVDFYRRHLRLIVCKSLQIKVL
ncbi:hypothetical protein D3C71_1918860 [compost metagenome]